MDRRATYRITLEGLLDPSWAEELGNMRIRHTRRTHKPPMTTLVGEVRDQAALSGLLNLARIKGIGAKYAALLVNLS